MCSSLVMDAKRRAAKGCSLRDITKYEDGTYCCCPGGASNPCIGGEQLRSKQMKEEGVDDATDIARRLRPLVVIVIVANLAVTALLLTTVRYAPPLSAPEIASLR